MSLRRAFAALLIVLSSSLLFAACGGGDDGGGGSAGTEETGATKGAMAVDPASMDSAKGDVTYCSGKDTSGDLKEGIKNFNKENPGIKVKLLEFPESADEQRSQFIQRQRAKSGECDGFESDVIWTAEFAQQKWLMDMSKYVESRKGDFIPSTLETVTYDGKNFGVPRVSDSAFLYMNTDAVKEAPATWQDVLKAAKAGDPKGYVFQGSAYEGLTCVFLEVAFAAGGKVISDDGKKSEFNSPENVKAVKFLVDAIKSGSSPKAVTTYMEEEARRTFESGKAGIMRNWPYAYSLGQKAPKVKGKIKVIPFPKWEGGDSAGILGGHNMVVSAYSKNPGATLKFIDYMTSAEVMKANAVDYSKTPVLAATFDDAEVKKAIPFADQLKQAVEQAKSRPVSPVYSLISEAIYKNVNAALSGEKTPEQAVKDADAGITKAIGTF